MQDDATSSILETVKRPKIQPPDSGATPKWRKYITNDFICVITLLFTSMVHFLPALVKGFYFGPYDILSQIPLTQQGAATPVNNGVSGDQIAQISPWLTYNWTTIHHGQLPLWNPYELLGLPQFFNFQTSVFGLPNLISYLVPVEFAYLVIVIMTLFIAGSGAYFFARCLKLSPLASLFAGVTFSLSGSIANWVGWPLSGVNAWLGWIFAFSFLLLTTTTRRRLYVTLLGVSIAFAVYGGHPESDALIGLAFVVFGVSVIAIGLAQHRWDWQHIARFVFWEGLAVVIGILLSAPLFLPGAQVITLAAKLQSATFSGGWPLSSMISLIIQGYNGYPTTSSVEFGYIGNMNYYEVSAYVGALAIIFAIYGVIVNRFKTETLALTITAIFWLIAVYQFGLYAFFVHMIHALNLIAITRGLMPLDFCLAILAGFGFQHMLSLLTKNEPIDHRLFMIGGGVLVILVGVAAVSLNHLPHPEKVIRLESFVWPGVLTLLLLVVGLLWQRKLPMGIYFKRYILVISQILFLTVAGMTENSFSSVGYPQTPAITTLQKTVGSGLVGKTDILKSGFLLDTNVPYGVRQFLVYDPVFPEMYYRSWTDITGQVVLYEESYFKPTIIDANIAKAYGIQYIIAPVTGIPALATDAPTQIAAILKNTPAKSAETQQALLTLLTLYVGRNDVQTAFPWATPGVVTTLLSWAINYDTADFKQDAPQLQVLLDYQAQHPQTQQAIFNLIGANPIPGMTLIQKTYAYQLYQVTDSAQFTLGNDNPSGILAVKWLNNYTCQIKVQSANATSLVARITNMPGWKAEVNGQSAAIHPWNDAMQQIAVPSGTSTVTLTYWPPLFSLGLWLAGAAVLALLLWWLLPAALDLLRKRGATAQ